MHRNMANRAEIMHPDLSRAHTGLLHSSAIDVRFNRIRYERKLHEANTLSMEEI